MIDTVLIILPITYMILRKPQNVGTLDNLDRFPRYDIYDLARDLNNGGEVTHPPLEDGRHHNLHAQGYSKVLVAERTNLRKACLQLLQEIFTGGRPIYLSSHRDFYRFRDELNQLLLGVVDRYSAEGILNDRERAEVMLQILPGEISTLLDTTGSGCWNCVNHSEINYPFSVMEWSPS
jgi:hypothetical protein